MDAMAADLRRGTVVRVEPITDAGGNGRVRRPALVIASDLSLEPADTPAIIVPVSTKNRELSNQVLLKGPILTLDQPSFAMTERHRMVARDRRFDFAGIEGDDQGGRRLAS